VGEANITPEEAEVTGNVTTAIISGDANFELPESTEGTGLVQSSDVAGNVYASVTGVEGTGATTTATTASRYLAQAVEGTGEVPLIDGSGPSFTAEGSAQLSTAQQKFGSASLLLDGTDDFVTSVENIDLSSGDFTVDIWIRPDNVTGYKGIWQSGTSTTAQSYLLGNQVYWTVDPSTIIISSVTVSAGVWTMLSYEREGNTHRIYKNGTLEATGTTSNKQDSGVFSVGKNGFGDFDGYIDEVRLSTSARYTGTSFTEPTSAFTVDGDTPVLLHFDGADTSTDIINERTASAVLVEGDANFSLTSVSATIITDQPDVVTDDVTVDADANVSVTGVEATVSPGTVTISDSAQPTFDSLTITSVVSGVTISATQNVFNVANRSAVRLARVPPAPPRIVYVGRAA